MAKPYVLPNRKAFADFIARIYLKYRTSLDAEDQDVDLCTRQGDSSRSTRDLFPYQRLVRDYLQIETPYRGVLLYHGLGSGKTCSSIAVAESLMSTRKVVVMLPASLQDNYRQEIRKCGDPIYILNNFWEVRNFRSEEEKAPALALGIPDEFLRTQGRYYVTIPGRESNYNTLPGDIREGIERQITAMINARYTFINYNGLNKESIKTIIPEEDAKTSTRFDDCVVIIDEAHNLISAVINESEVKGKLYAALYHAKNCKVVALSGTPIINRPNEIAYMMNLLRGPIERISIAVKEIANWDESAIQAYLRRLPEVDAIEFNSIKRTLQVTRNPPHFKSVYNDKGERYAVQFDEKVSMTTPQDWVDTLRESFSASFSGAVLAPREEVVVEQLECLPTNFSDFVNMFVDGLEVKNALLFQRRIQGLVSYYRGGDERMLPKMIDNEPDQVRVRVPMSEYQFTKYLEVRWKEIQQESQKSRGSASLNEDFSSYRVGTRLICDYAVPTELKEPTEKSENEEPDKSAILATIKADPTKYLSPDGLKTYSPKLLKALENAKASAPGNQFVYSQYLQLEGLNLFAAVLEANGFQEYKLVKEDGKYKQSPALDPAKPAFAFYVGGDPEEREIMRLLFNEDYRGLNQNYPQHAQSLRESIGGKRPLSILMATAAGAEGINLKNVRHLHILEPHWNPARHAQVIGRGVRLCSHASRDLLDEQGRITNEIVPVEDRTIKVSFYMSVFSEEQSTSADYPNIVPIRRADTLPKYYDAKVAAGAAAPTSFMSTDEFLYEKSYEKGRLTEGISKLIKQAAVDCEIHRKLHSRGQPVLQCMRFDTSVSNDDLAFNPSIKQDPLDASVLRNRMKRARRLQKMKIKGILFVVDIDTNEVFDADSFLDSERLLRVGIKEKDRIKFFMYT